MKIAVGTTSSYKVNAIKKVFHELDFEFEAFAVTVESNVSEQPAKAGETRQGSINRARNALAALPEPNLAIGVEFGYEPDGEIYRMVCWATIATKEGKLFSEHSSSLELPKKLKEVLASGEEISDNLNKVTSRLRDTERNRIFINYLKKRKFIYEAVQSVTVRYLLDQEAYI